MVAVEVIKEEEVEEASVREIEEGVEDMVEE